MHAAQAPASSLHSKDADPSGEVNPSDAEALAVSEAGAVVMLVSGAVVSTVQVAALPRGARVEIEVIASY